MWATKRKFWNQKHTVHTRGGKENAVDKELAEEKPIIKAREKIAAKKLVREKIELKPTLQGVAFSKK